MIGRERESGEIGEDGGGRKGREVGESMDSSVGCSLHCVDRYSRRSEEGGKEGRGGERGRVRSMRRRGRILSTTTTLIRYDRKREGLIMD